VEDPRGKLNEALKEAMKNKDNQRRDVIRMVLSGIKQVEVDTRKELSAEDVVAVLQKEIKTRRESREESRKAGRLEQVSDQQKELDILEAFLPKQLSREEIAVLAKEAIAQAGATTAKEMGKVMGFLMPKVKGLADGKLINEVVRELLN